MTDETLHDEAIEELLETTANTFISGYLKGADEAIHATMTMPGLSQKQLDWLDEWRIMWGSDENRQRTLERIAPAIREQFEAKMAEDGGRSEESGEQRWENADLDELRIIGQWLKQRIPNATDSDGDRVLAAADELGRIRSRAGLRAALAAEHHAPQVDE